MGWDNAGPRNIVDIAVEAGIQENELEPYGRYKAKIDPSILDRISDRPDGRYIVVTAITPTMIQAECSRRSASRNPNMNPMYTIANITAPAAAMTPATLRSRLNVSRAITNTAIMPVVRMAIVFVVSVPGVVAVWVGML